MYLPFCLDGLAVRFRIGSDEVVEGTPLLRRFQRNITPPREGDSGTLQHQIAEQCVLDLRLLRIEPPTGVGSIQRKPALRRIVEPRPAVVAADSSFLRLNGWDRDAGQWKTVFEDSGDVETSCQ